MHLLIRFVQIYKPNLRFAVAVTSINETGMKERGHNKESRANSLKGHLFVAVDGNDKNYVKTIHGGAYPPAAHDLKFLSICGKVPDYRNQPRIIPHGTNTQFARLFMVFSHGQQL